MYAVRRCAPNYCADVKRASMKMIAHFIKKGGRSVIIISFYSIMCGQYVKSNFLKYFFFHIQCDAYDNLATLPFYVSYSYFIYTGSWMSTPYIFTPALFQGPIYQRYVNFKSLDQILSKRTCRSMYYVICMYVQWFYPKGSRELQRSFAVDSSTPSGGLV